jgi:hypothetical protein
LGDAVCRSDALRFDSPDDAALRYKLGIVWGAKAKPPVFISPGGFAVNALMHVAARG